jgi:hypothetical protein
MAVLFSTGMREPDDRLRDPSQELVAGARSNKKGSVRSIESLSPEGRLPDCQELENLLEPRSAPERPGRSGSSLPTALGVRHGDAGNIHSRLAARTLC